MSVITLTPGANAPVPDLPGLILAVGWMPQAPAGMDIDASAFLVTEAGTVPSDEHFVFYGAQTAPGGAVRFLPTAATGDAGDLQAFVITPASVAPEVASIDICLTIHEGQARGQSFGQLTGLRARLLNAADNSEIARFALPAAGMSEAAITLVRVYRRAGAWKIRAVGQGFVGGLAPLARQYGVDVAEDAAPPSPPPPPPPAPPPPARPVSLSKVTLEKRGQSISLEKKQERGFGEIRINLNWSRGEAKRSGGLLGGLFGGNRGIDLDLGCLWEAADGNKGCVQALGGTLGAYDEPPYVRHAGDDRTGDRPEGENMTVNGDHLSRLRRILIYAFIYEGVPNWAAADGVAMVRMAGHPDIEVRLDSPEANQGLCAIAMLENDGGRLKLTKEERYFRDHRELDLAYGWGLRWVAGSK